MVFTMLIVAVVVAMTRFGAVGSYAALVAILSWSAYA